MLKTSAGDEFSSSAISSVLTDTASGSVTVSGDVETGVLLFRVSLSLAELLLAAVLRVLLFFV